MLPKVDPPAMHSFIYSKISKQRTQWEQYKFSCCVIGREVVVYYAPIL